MATLILELGWCGFGYAGGLVPEVRLGLLRVTWCRGSLMERVRRWNLALIMSRDSHDDQKGIGA